MDSERSGEEANNVILKISVNQNLNHPKSVKINDVILFFINRSATVKLLITSS